MIIPRNRFVGQKRPARPRHRPIPSRTGAAFALHARLGRRARTPFRDERSCRCPSCGVRH